MHGSCYVKGRLQPTRAFGDFMLKDEKYVEELARGRRRRATCPPNNRDSSVAAAAATPEGENETWSFPYVVAEPQTQTLTRTGSESFIVVGTDGLWDFLNPTEAAAVVRSSLSNSGNSTPTQAARDAANA